MQSINRLIEKSKNARRAFTLVELMLVIAIMGLMGMLSVGGYRAMRRGMEERGVIQNAEQFIKLAYERAMIEGLPTVVYFWNETRQDEDEDDGSGTLIVVGHAVAVRQTGRISQFSGGCLVDEFGDLRFFAGTDEEGQEDDDAAEDLASSEGATMNLYCMKPGGGLSENRVSVAPSTVPTPQSLSLLLTDDDWSPADNNVKAYGYKIKKGGGGQWTAGMPYGTEFAEMTLPNNYIFGSSFKTSTADPIAEVNQAIWFYPPTSDATGGGSKTISISAIRPGSDGSPSAQGIGQTKSPVNN